MKDTKSISTSTRRRIIKDFMIIFEEQSLKVRNLKMSDYKLERYPDSKDEKGDYHLFSTDMCIPTTLYSIFACEKTKEECKEQLSKCFPQLDLLKFKFYFYKNYVIAII